MRSATLLALPLLMASDCNEGDGGGPPPTASLEVRWTAIPGCPQDSIVSVTLDDNTADAREAPCASRAIDFAGLDLGRTHVAGVVLRSSTGAELAVAREAAPMLVPTSESDANMPNNFLSIDLVIQEACVDPDGADEDGDGLANCADPDCAQLAECTPSGAPMASFSITGNGRPKLFRDPFKPGRYVMVGFADQHIAAFDSGLDLPYTAAGGISLTGATVVDAKPAGSGALRVVGQHADAAYVAKLTSTTDPAAGITQFVYGPSGKSSDARAFVPSSGGNVVIGNLVDTTTKIAVALFNLAFTNLQVYSVISDGVFDWNVLAAAAVGSDNAIVGVRGSGEAAFVIRASGQGQLLWQTLLKTGTSLAIELDNVAALPTGDVAAVGIEVLPGGAQAGLFVVLDGVTGAIKVKRRTSITLPLTAIVVDATGRISIGGAFGGNQLVAEITATGELGSVFASTQPADRMSLALDSDSSRVTGAMGQDTAFLAHEPATTCSYDPPVNFPSTLVDSDALEETPALTSIQVAATIGNATAVPTAQVDTLTAVCP